MPTPAAPAPAAPAPGPAPLEGLLVADFSRVLAGPLATMTLADLGARVVKVERPGSGDETRRWGPPHSVRATADGDVRGTTYFDSVNRNKESVCLDLTDAGDLALARTLALRADVLVENFRPGVMDALGLGADALRAHNPGLVYVSISGFGTTGGAHLPGYDFVAQAVGGLMSITGTEGEPTKAGVALVDVLCGKDAVIAVLAALERRRATGLGTTVAVDLLSSLQGALVNQVQAHLGAGVVPRAMGNAHPSIAPYELLACADGPLAVACGTDAHFARLAGVLGAPALAADERFATNTARVAHRAALVPLLEERLATAGAAAWQERLAAAGVPAGRVATIGEGLELAADLGLDPVIDVHDADGAVVGRQVRHPARWDPPLPARTAAPPLLGEHEGALRAWLSSPEPTLDAPPPRQRPPLGKDTP